MGAGEVGSPKWVAKRMKMKGLQKLRWYCQACEKQCRDEHGFKLHASSPSHMVKAKTAHERKLEYSKQFESQFRRLLTNHYSRPVSANKVYNELVQDKQHVRMNATRFPSLTAFVRHLESNGIVKITALEPELMIQYIDREAQFRQQKQKEMQMQRAIEQDQAERKVLEATIESEKTAFLKFSEETAGIVETRKPGNNENTVSTNGSNASMPGARPKISFNLKKR